MGLSAFVFLYRYIKFKGYQGLDEYLSLGMTGGGGGEALVMVMGIRDIELGHG